MKRKVCCVIILAMIAAILCSCASRAEWLQKDETGYYLILGDDYAQYMPGISPDIVGDGNPIRPPMERDSWKIMIRDIHNNNFSNSEKEWIALLYYVMEKENDIVYITDLDNLYEPVLPECFDGKYRVAWLVVTYQLLAENEDYSIEIKPIDEADYLEGIEDCGHAINAESTENLGNDLYRFNAYTISARDTVLYVKNVFYQEFGLYPHHLLVYGKSGSQCFKAEIRYKSMDISDYPSTEFLASISIKPYNEP